MVRILVVNPDALIAPWLDVIRAQVPELELFDAHTHVGENDPDGMRMSPDELLADLRVADAKGCFVFPMHEPDGYPAANDAVIAAAERSEGLLVPFCRVKPGEGAHGEAVRSLTRGARGIKLHPRAEEFTLDHPEVRQLFALADERTLPILIHAGRGIPALGEHVLRYATDFPNARVILAHAAVTDLAWIWRVLPDTPNVLLDCAWWLPADLTATFTLVPPAQVLFASDAPYGTTLAAAAVYLRLALQAGYSAEQLRLMSAGQSLRIAAGDPLGVAGPAPGERERAPHVLLDRVAELLQLATILTFRTGDAAEQVALARLACDVPSGLDDAPIFAAVRTLLDAYPVGPEPRSSIALLMLAGVIARTPDIPLPAVTLVDQP